MWRHRRAVSSCGSSPSNSTKSKDSRLMSFPAGIASRPLASSSDSTPPSSSSTESTDKLSADCYSHILTHQEKKKQRMPKHKANSWPTSILTDPDVLSLDDEGRFVLCKVCHVHYAVHGGKKPKPVIMNSSFRCRAWEVHKERTNSHRLHKKDTTDQSSRPSPRSEPEEQKEEGSPRHLNLSVPQVLPPRQQLMENQQDLNSPRFSPPPPIAPLAPRPNSNGDHVNKHQSSPRRRVFRQSPAQGASRQWAPPQHDLPRRGVNHNHEHSRVPAASTHVIGERSTQPSMKSAEQQASGLLRWRNMHDDVSRALGSVHKRPLPNGYDAQDLGGSMRMSETEDFAGNNERVAKKLRSLDEEYDAKTLKRPEACFDRRSEMYKQYWGTLRDVYNSANHNPNATQGQADKGMAQFRRPDEQQGYSKESGDDFTTPDDSGSSESVVKPVVVHDQALINALDRLTGVISKQYSDRFSEESAMLLDAVGKLTHSVDEMRMHQGASLNRLVQLQEQKLRVMEETLRHKMEKHRANISANHAARPPSTATEVNF